MIYILYILVIYGDPNILVRNHRDNVLPDSFANDTQQGDGDHIMRGDFEFCPPANVASEKPVRTVKLWMLQPAEPKKRMASK